MAFGDKEEMIFRPFCDGNIAFAGNNGVIPNCSSFNKNVGGTYVAGEELKDQKSLKFLKITINKFLVFGDKEEMIFRPFCDGNIKHRFRLKQWGDTKLFQF